eukprot:jgi/Bigna1/127557/aug1.4_g2265
MIQAEFCSDAPVSHDLDSTDAAAACKIVDGHHRESGTLRGSLWEATAGQLEPSTKYTIRVMERPGVWGKETYLLSTAPSTDSVDQSFKFVFVADFGLVGRLDGLTNGTARVLSLVERLNPLMVLIAGDLAYGDTDVRFKEDDESIDYFFEQIQPFARKTVLMPTYGNHERHQSINRWNARFAIPPGMVEPESGIFFSFSVGSVRFISIASVKCHGGLRNNALRWVRKELEAAKNDKSVKWTIPYFHVSPFASGKSHPSNIRLRRQLLGMFHQYGVRVVLNAHDQNYERTHPVLPADTSLSNDDGAAQMYYKLPRKDNAITATTQQRQHQCYDSDTEGVIFVKTSPGGKLSAITKTFSWFEADSPPPTYAAVRDDKHHHVLNVQVSEDGNSMDFECLGISDDAEHAIVIDKFHYTISKGGGGGGGGGGGETCGSRLHSVAEAEQEDRQGSNEKPLVRKDEEITGRGSSSYSSKVAEKVEAWGSRHGILLQPFGFSVAGDPRI